MKVMVVSATPKQLDSVGAWQTMMPSSVAASVSTSSTPTVYFATMRSRCEACMMRRLIGVWRMDVPMSATASRAASPDEDHPYDSSLPQERGSERRSIAPSLLVLKVGVLRIG